MRENADTFNADVKKVCKKLPVSYALMKTEGIRNLKTENLEDDIKFDVKAVDNENIKSHAGIFITINGQKVTATTDANGVATFTLTKALLKSSGIKTVNIVFAGDDVYQASSAVAKITVNKENVKLTVKSVKKTYKKAKTKKIKITLKNSKNKVIKGKFNVILKVSKKLKGSVGKKLKKGKVFKVKFNKKGIGYITLKNKQVKGFKKGTYKFTVTFKGNSIYNKATKKNIKMKVK